MATSVAPGILPEPKTSESTTFGFSKSEAALAFGFVALHIALAVAMRAQPAIATAHAIATVGIGLVYAATTKRLRNLGVIAGYLAGCEVLWRMTSADVFWEFGKYSIAAVLLVGVLRAGSRRNRGLALAYFGLLLPSVALSFEALDFERARQELSFNLSGPFALTIAVLYFSSVRYTGRHLVATFCALIAPVVGIGALSFISTAAQDRLEFVNAASSVTSGGYGPNQVSSMLGLAVLFLVLVALDRRSSWSIRLPLIVLAAALATQSALTFSRGGIASALAASALAMFVVLQGNRRGRVTVLIVGVIAGVLGNYVIEPKLEQLTQGEISERYTSTKSSGRDLFIASEIEIFEEHPILGVGPGVGMELREERGLFFGASHTEYSRMLAEHGVFGLFAIFVLIALGFRAVKNAREPMFRAAAAAMVLWVAIFLLIYGTRLAAPAFVFGLAFALRSPPKPRRNVIRT